ncbi:germinal-center associated nuclear protein-like [Sarcophilus harrisii]
MVAQSLVPSRCLTSVPSARRLAPGCELVWKINSHSLFGRQPSSGFSSSTSGSLGTFQVQPPFRFGQPLLFGQSGVGSRQNTGLAQTSGGTQSSSGAMLGFPANSGIGPHSVPALQAPVFTAASGPPSTSAPGNSGFSFKTPTNIGAFHSTPSFGPGSGKAFGLSPSEFSFKLPESASFIQSSSGSMLGFPANSGIGPHSVPALQAPVFTAASGPPSTSAPSNAGFSFKTPTNNGAFPNTPSFGPGSGKASGLSPSEFSFKLPESASFIQSSSGSMLGFPANSGIGPHSVPALQAPIFTAASGPPSTSAPSNAGFSFKTPTNNGAFHSTPSFGPGSGKASGLSPSEFSFKLPESASFIHPIFGAELEPEKTQSQITPGSFTVSHPVSGGPEPLVPFTFSLGSSSSGTNPSFTFSKAASNSSTFASSSQNVEEEKRGPKPTFGNSGSSFPSFPLPGSVGEPFSMSKAVGKLGRDDASGQGGLLSGQAKGLKKKEDHDLSLRRRDYDVVDDVELLSREDHPPKKRPHRLARPRGGGLFGPTLQDKLRSNKEGGRLGSKEIKKEVGSLESSETDHGAAAGATSAMLSILRLKEEEMDGKSGQEVSANRITPSRRGKKERVDSSSSLSSSELTAIQCKNIPNYVNNRAILKDYFGRFGKVQRISPRRNRKLAIVYFSDHASAALARKKGKGLHKRALTFWHKKKISPSKKDFSPKEKKSSEGEASQSCEDSPFQRSPLHKPLLRPATGAGSSLLSKSSPIKKSSHTKSLQFEGEPFDSWPEIPSSDNLGLSATTLSTLMGTVAETSEDKYRLLDQRDKILRQARVKRTDLDKAKAFVGTCPDMCPEKERYMRETTNQLSSFEVIPGTNQVDHAVAIKEYSRSSADQEEPLPHELRPPGVLSMTMDYLVTQIMDQREGRSRDWYDFVWNRTRGIRKDITQQDLCDPLTVSLIEKCTRFHIHCAHSMCEEPMCSFDAKINYENLTKCLQSLKEMYQDLANKGVLCASEAEFRGYNVLLNLHKGDILREVQQFRPDVRNSPEVKFAVQAFAALNSNNFARFFKVVRSASYLNACLLHCYFNQIRKDALRALNVAYTASAQRSTSFPLDKLVPMLLFRDAEEATDFLSYCGLSVSDGCVKLNRSAFLKPEGLSKAKKCTFITEKLTVSVGEVVNGGPLPPVPPHIPVCSFNTQNKYVGESAVPESALSGQKPSVESGGGGKMEEASPGTEVLALRVPPQPLLSPPQPLLTQTAGLPPALVAPAPVLQLAAPSSLFQPVGQPELPPPKPCPSYTDTDIMGVIEDLIQDVLTSYCEEVGRAGAAYTAAALGVSEMATEEVLVPATVDMLRQIAADEENKERARIKEEQKRVEEPRRRGERERLVAPLSQVPATELMDVQETSSQELKSAMETERRARVARSSEDVCDDLMDLFLAEEIFQSARETLQELQCFCKYLQQWREAAASRKRLKRKRRAFPAAPCCVDLSNRLQALSPSAECPIAKENLAKGVLNLGHAGKLGVSCTRLQWMRNKTIHQMKVQYFYQQLLSAAAWTPLDLPALIAENYPGEREQVFWKLVLVLPDSEEPASSHSSRILANWLKVKFMGYEDLQKGARHASKGIQTLTQLNACSTKGNRTVRVNVCIKVAHGLLSDSALEATKTQKDLLGTSGLLFLLPAPGKSDMVAEEDTYWLSAMLQLKQLLQAKPFHPPVPLVVLVPGQEGASVRDVEEGLMLQDLVSSQLISDYIVVEIPGAVNDLQGTNRVSQTVKWLVSRCPSSLELCCQTLPQYIEDGISREFSDRFFYDRKERHVAGLASQEPGAIIELFNGVLQFLADVASSEQLGHLSWPITEFAEPGGNKVLPHLQWNAPGHLAWLKEVILSFQLPHLDLPPPGAPWRLVCNMISQYISQIPSCCQTQPILQSQVENLLSRTYSKWRNKDPWALGETGPCVEEIPWDDLIALCINHKLRDWKPPRLPVTSEALSEDGQICVYFFKTHLKSYEVPRSWEHARLQTQKEIQRHSHGGLGIKPLLSAKSLSSAWFHVPYGGARTPETGHARRVPDGKELARTASAEELLPGRLSATLQREKEESRRFEDQLRHWLAGDRKQGPDSSTLPIYLPQALLSTPQTLQPFLRVSATSSHQEQKATEWQRPAPATVLSLNDKLRRLESLIQLTREEDLVCERHLSTLLDMVDI